MYGSQGVLTSAAAFDDISFNDNCLFDPNGAHGELPITTTVSSSCPSGFSPCKNGGCYDITQRCDFLYACNDAQPPDASTDENTCGKLDLFFVENIIDFLEQISYSLCPSNRNIVGDNIFC